MRRPRLRLRPNRAAPYTRPERERGAELARMRQTELFAQPWEQLFFQGLRFVYKHRSWDHEEGMRLLLVRFWPPPTDEDYQLVDGAIRNGLDAPRWSLQLDDPEEGVRAVRFNPEAVLDGLWCIMFDDPDAEERLSQVGLGAMPWFRVIRGNLLDARAEASNIFEDIRQSVMKPPLPLAVARETLGTVTIPDQLVVLEPGRHPELIREAALVLAADASVGFYWLYLVTDPWGRDLEVPSDLSEGFAKYNAASNAAGPLLTNFAPRRRAREPEPVRQPGARLVQTREFADGELVALLMNPKLKRIVPAYYRAHASVEISGPHEHGDYSARGSLDPVLLRDCARTHTPRGARPKGEGYGTALYVGLGTVAYQAYSLGCVASIRSGEGYGHRSGEADRWWAAAVDRGLAERNAGPLSIDATGGAQILRLERSIERGLVLWLREPGDYEGLLAATLPAYLPALLTASLGFETEEAARALAWAMRMAGAPDAAEALAEGYTANASVDEDELAELVEQADELYAGLDDLPG